MTRGGRQRAADAYTWSMWRAASVCVVAWALACAAPSPSPPPPSSVCQSDADCELVSAPPPRCCSRCEPTAMTRAAAEAAGKQCRALEKAGGDYVSRCPHLSCPCTRSTARCAEQKCVLESRPC